MYNHVGNLVWQAELDIYGKIRTLERGSIQDCPFRYQGQYEDVETGLYYNRFRYYSPESGTYISQDPIGLAGNNPNIYAYVWDSNAWIDPFGLSEGVYAEMQSYIFTDAWMKGPHANIMGPKGKLAEAFLQVNNGKLNWVLKHDSNVPKKLRKQVNKVVEKMIDDDAIMQIAKEQTDKIIKDLENQSTKNMKDVAKRNLPRFKEMLKLFCK
ncbi:RHS repeat-associated core domain-containing protein [Rapidithrix thailandica]|uniref:RHS repeat-associated core domain-containing protein n=1 Tax=Rapidithrix thailandica TaxID=413964 RepID=A0AAW9S8Z2_9BACT